jgi:S-DNA-T family DNA segregation ATPase FtsK/SpoIIIE
LSTTLSRGTRLDPPTMPEGELVLQTPPELAPHEGAGGALMMALPMLGSVGSIVFIAAAQPGGRSMIAAGMFLVATLGFVGVQIDRQRKQRSAKIGGARREYLQYLAGVRKVVREAADQQRRSLMWHHPAPEALPALAEDRQRLWERSPDHDDYLLARYGRSSQALALRLVPPETAPVEQLDPVAASALHRLLVVHRNQPDLPAKVDLRAFSRIEVTGDEAPARGLARAMVCSAAAAHRPEDLVVAVLTGAGSVAEWEWAKWLPHAQSTEDTDAIGPSRMVCDSLDDLAAMLPRSLVDRPRFGSAAAAATPHLLLVVDGGSLPPGNHLVPEEGVHGVTVLDLPEQWGELTDPTRLRLHLEGATTEDGTVPLTGIQVYREPFRAMGDQMNVAGAEAFARRLAPLHVAQGPAREDSLTRAPELPDLLGLADVRTFDLASAWQTRPQRDRLRVPVGIGDSGTPVTLDIKESAQQGMGPHGLVIGATGSGKSEFLRTLVLGLAMTHSSEVLNMVLVDFKGGATFAGLSEMPHVSAVITNLENELTLVDRMQDALSGEMVRRQELLRRAGNYASLKDYERARITGEADLEPLPSLFIVVDEFSEMLSAKPEFIDLFVAIGRLGRSLGLHLLLASQRLEEGRLRGLESHLSYRIGLRTFSAAESRAVLGVPDAYELPSVPGLGYLKPDQSTLLKFKAAYVSGPPPRQGRGTVNRGSGGLQTVLPFSLGHVLAPQQDEGEDALVENVAGPSEATDNRSLLDVAVSRMVGQGPEAHKVWLPPLDVPDTLDALLPDLVEDPDLGLVSPSWRARGRLTVSLGTVDRPREQRRDTLTVNLTGAGGHVAVVGGPRSGKSTMLRTIVTTLALTTTPQETQFYVLDFGGGTFAPLTDLPHVSGVASRSEPDVVRRIYAEVSGIVDRRERYFRSQGIDSIETYRERRRNGAADDGYGDVFLVVDGWSTLRSDFDELEMSLQSMAQRGLTFGLHLVAGAARWADFRAATRDLLGTRLELRLGDPMDSEIDRKVAQLVPSGRPGRGLVPAKLHFLGALPRIDGEPDGATTGPGVEDLVERVRKAWRGPTGPKLRLLPEKVELDEVLARVAERHELSQDRGLYLAIDEKDLAPVGLDVDREPHLLAFGDSRSGKSALLRSYLREVMRTRTAQEAQVVVVDYRRSLLGEVPEDYALHYLTSAAQAAPAFTELAQYLEGRLPGPDVTPEQLRSRSWWTGAEVFVVVDDYDLVATQAGSPVAPLVPLLAQARDVGLHLVVARRSGGASRALYEPVIQSLRDLAMPGLLLSGSPDEGPLIGTTKPRPGIAGRGQLITRDRGVEVVQTVWSAASV